MTLKNKHFVLGISGGIAAYKSANIIRLLVKKGAEVQVIITPSGKEFITPLTLSTLSGKPVISEFFTPSSGQWNSHVDLGLWADAMIIAPATASTISKMAHGIADNMLITTYLSMRAPIFVAPAMDLDMLKHPTTTRNIKIIQNDNVNIIDPKDGELASHLIGKGRMEEPENIVSIIENYFSKSKDLENKNILITAGPTYEKIDPVRFIGNYSSGKMGYNIAKECANRGAKVKIVSGPVDLSISHPNIEIIKIESASQMHNAVLDLYPNSDISFFTAAVADYSPKNYNDTKIKKNGEEILISLQPNIDIAESMGKIKNSNQINIGFSLETDNEIINAKNKLIKKNFDFIVLNSLRDKGAGFKHDTNKITIISNKLNDIKSFELKSKQDVAKDIVDYLKNFLD